MGIRVGKSACLEMPLTLANGGGRVRIVWISHWKRLSKPNRMLEIHGEFCNGKG